MLTTKSCVQALVQCPCAQARLFVDSHKISFRHASSLLRRSDLNTYILNFCFYCRLVQEKVYFLNWISLYTYVYFILVTQTRSSKAVAAIASETAAFAIRWLSTLAFHLKNLGMRSVSKYASSELMSGRVAMALFIWREQFREQFVLHVTRQDNWKHNTVQGSFIYTTLVSFVNVFSNVSQNLTIAL